MTFVVVEVGEFHANHLILVSTLSQNDSSAHWLQEMRLASFRWEDKETTFWLKFFASNALVSDSRSQLEDVRGT